MTRIRGILEADMIVPIVVVGVGLAMLVIELLRPGRRWPSVAGWWWRAILLNAVQAGMVFVAFRNPRTWEARCGFGEGERRLPEMLRGVDVMHPKGGEAS